MTTTSFGMVFPGQGSQEVGMLQELAAEFPQVKETFQQAAETLGFDLWALVQDGPEEDLNQTQNTQPAMLTAGVAVWRVWQAQDGPPPSLMAGHSLGEYSALVCADALAFADAVHLVAERGRLMQQAVPPGQGSMAAILGLDDDQMRGVCQQAAEGAVVEAVNFNAPGQVVIAGNTEAVQRAADLAKGAGAKRALLLPVSVPSHCALMKSAAEQLAARLTEVTLRMPEIPVLHNVNVASAGSEAEIRDLLTRQMYCPVRWVETVQAMAIQGATRLVEAGPGKVLTGLGKRIDKTLGRLAVFDPASMAKALETLNNA